MGKHHDQEQKNKMENDCMMDREEAEIEAAFGSKATAEGNTDGNDKTCVNSNTSHAK